MEEGGGGGGRRGGRDEADNEDEDDEEDGGEAGRPEQWKAGSHLLNSLRLQHNTTTRPPATHIPSTQQPPFPTPYPILNGLLLRYTSHLLNSLLSQRRPRYPTASVSDTPPIWSTASRYKRAPVGSRLKSRTPVRPPMRPPPAVRRPSLPRFQYHAARPTRRPPVGVPRVPPGISATVPLAR